jgi:outer membrane lipoprotein SlyB
MLDTSRLHPLIVIAAIAVILTCLLAIGVMTGIVPSPLAKDRVINRDDVLSAPPPQSQGALAASPSGSVPAAQNAYAPATRTPPARNPVVGRVPPVSSPPAAIGSTADAGSSGTVSGGVPAAAPRECTHCGSIISVRAVKQQGEAGMIGPAAGGLVGGLVGHQIGSGRGNTIATVVGAAAGAAGGTEIERRYKSKTHYIVAVRMNDGRVRRFTYAAAPGVQTGEKVRVVGGKLVRD